MFIARSKPLLHFRYTIEKGSSRRSPLFQYKCLYYSSLSSEDEEKEKQRVASLSKYQKEMELREYDKEIARLNTLRGINTGELYTMRGKFKALARDYGMAFMAWYWTGKYFFFFFL